MVVATKVARLLAVASTDAALLTEAALAAGRNVKQATAAAAAATCVTVASSTAYGIVTVICLLSSRYIIRCITIGTSGVLAGIISIGGRPAARYFASNFVVMLAFISAIAFIIIVILAIVRTDSLVVLVAALTVISSVPATVIVAVAAATECLAVIASFIGIKK
jgi:hypothetical protein